MPISIDFDNCNDKYCEVKRNVQASLKITFKATKDATDLNASVQAQIAGNWLPWPLGQASKVCKNLVQGTCPVAENDEATYGFGITIPSIAPVGTHTTVQIQIKDQTNSMVACTRIPIVVVA